MKVIVIGAGVIGTTSAWFLAREGHEVEVVDADKGSGLVTSFANGGQISVSQAEPWANPGAPLKIIKWLGREDAPLMFRMRADSRQWSWAFRFLIECLPSRTLKNTLAILKLGIYSRERLQHLRREEQLNYHQIEKGILQLHTDEQEFEKANLRLAELLSYGLDMSVCDAAKIIEIEPALRQSTIPFVGATYAADDESGDAHLFTRELEQVARSKLGVNFHFDSPVVGFLGSGERISGIRVADEFGKTYVKSADAYVVATGSSTSGLMAPLGISLPIFPVKGYSLTAPILDEALAPTVCLTDENGKIAMSRLGDQLRMAGTAELNGFDLSISDVRCRGILDRVRRFFPEGIDYDESRPWAGLRPTTPSNIPYIGRTKYSNLFLNAGHGTLGWTLSCGSSAALADIVSGRRPDLDFPFLS
ncbi:MAG: D-amino acid dehydrogenase [Betaproteobacteria bacterium]